MSRVHIGIGAVLLIVLGVSIILGVILWKLALFPFSGLAKEEEVNPVNQPGFSVTAEATPKEEEAPPPPAQQAPPKEEPVSTASAPPSSPPEKSRGQLWYESLQGTGKVWKREGADEAIMAGNFSSGGSGQCDTREPMPTPIKLVGEATTDEPGEAMGIIAEDIQGTFPDGKNCVAIPAMTQVTLEVSGAGDYPNSRAPMTVKTIWLDGQKLEVGKKAVMANGIPGVEGDANHHIPSKIGAGVASTLFSLANNASQFGSVNVNSGAVTNPVQDALTKTLKKPSEIHVKDKPTIYVWLDPIKTKGY